MAMFEEITDHEAINERHPFVKENNLTAAEFMGSVVGSKSISNTVLYTMQGRNFSHWVYTPQTSR